MRATFKLLNIYFWRTIYGPVLAFVFPTLLLAIMGNILKIEYVLPGILALTSLFIAVQAMPLGIMELKNSTLFKYIGSTPVNPRRFIISAIFYYVCIDFFAIILLMFMGMFIFFSKVFPEGLFTVNSLYSGIITPVGFFSFICANSLHIILSLAIGISIATFSKTPQQALTIALLIIIPSMFLSGMVLSVDIIAESSVMQWISRLNPFRYTTGNIVIATTPVNQLGNLMDAISLQNKKLVFNIVGEITNKIDSNGNHLIHYFKVVERTGLIISMDGKHFLQSSDILITPTSTLDVYSWKWSTAQGTNRIFINIYDMKRFFHENLGVISPIQKRYWFSGNDSTLFKSIFLSDGAMTGADNNMFGWTGAFGVRRVPSVDAIEAFMVKFFKGDSNNDPSRFLKIWNDYIQGNSTHPNGDFSFLDLFTKQNVILYTIAERVLNTIIPTIGSIGMIWYSVKNFKWSAR